MILLLATPCAARCSHKTNRRIYKRPAPCITTPTTTLPSQASAQTGAQPLTASHLATNHRPGVFDLMMMYSHTTTKHDWHRVCACLPRQQVPQVMRVQSSQARGVRRGVPLPLNSDKPCCIQLMPRLPEGCLLPAIRTASSPRLADRQQGVLQDEPHVFVPTTHCGLLTAANTAPWIEAPTPAAPAASTQAAITWSRHSARLCCGPCIVVSPEQARIPPLCPPLPTKPGWRCMDASQQSSQQNQPPFELLKYMWGRQCVHALNAAHCVRPPAQHLRLAGRRCCATHELYGTQNQRRQHHC